MRHRISFGLRDVVVLVAFQEAFERVQPPFPVVPVVVEPLCCLAQALSLQGTVMRPSLDFPMDQSGPLQHFQVFGDAIEREIEQLSHLQDGEAFVC